MPPILPSPRFSRADRGREAAGALLYNALSFFDHDDLLRRQVRDVIPGAARPLDVDRSRGRIVAKTKALDQIALGRVARATADHAPLLSRGAGDAHDGADAVAIGPDTARPHGDP